MLTGLTGGALWALDTVILGMALALPVFTGDPRAAILAPFASTFLHDLCSFLWMLGYTGLRRQYKAVWQALRTRGGRFVALGALLGGPVGMTGYVLAINAIGPAYTAIISALYPALGTVLAHFFLKEKLRPIGLIGLALSIGGATPPARRCQRDSYWALAAHCCAVSAGQRRGASVPTDCKAAPSPTPRRCKSASRCRR